MRLARILDTRALVNCRFRAAVAFACRRAVASLAVIALAALPALAADRVAGANETMNMEPGARSAALGSATMAVDGDYLGLVSNPHQLSSVRYFWASFSHTAYYEDTHTFYYDGNCQYECHDDKRSDKCRYYHGDKSDALTS